jgi:hypothetical protein
MTKETQDLLSFAAGDGVQLDLMDAKPAGRPAKKVLYLNGQIWRIKK